MKYLKIVLNTRVIFMFFALCWLVSLQGCMQYYKVKKVSNITAQDMEKFIAKRRFIIIHQDNKARYLSNAGVSDNALTGELVNLRDNQMKFKSTKPKGVTRYRNTKKHNEEYVTNEVHLYLKKSVVQDFGSAQKVMITLSDIAYTDVYLTAQGRSTMSWIAPGLLVGSAVFVGGVILFLNALGEAFANSFTLDIM